MCEFSVEFVFGSLDKALAAELFDFWNLNQASYQEELKSFRSHGDLSEIEPQLIKQKVLKRQPVRLLEIKRDLLLEWCLLF
jgi:hypothetical protein